MDRLLPVVGSGRNVGSAGSGGNVGIPVISGGGVGSGGGGGGGGAAAGVECFLPMTKKGPVRVGNVVEGYGTSLRLVQSH